MGKTRIERDSIGEMLIPADADFGIHTARAVENFPITGILLGHYPEFVQSLAMVKKAAAMANRALPGAVDYPQIPALAERGLARVAQFFTLLNERLAGHDFIAADRFSVADITAVVAVDFARVVKQKPGEQHPHLLRWRAAMAGRPSMSL